MTSHARVAVTPDMQNASPIRAIERLPIEVVFVILDHAACESQACLVTLCRVNKTLQARYEPVLYRHVDVLSPRGYVRLHRALQAKPHLQKEIRHLALGPFVYPDRVDSDEKGGWNHNWWHSFEQWRTGRTLQTDLDNAFDFALFPQLRRLFIQADAVPWWTYKHLTATVEEVTIHYRNDQFATEECINAFVKCQTQVARKEMHRLQEEGSWRPTSMEMFQFLDAPRGPLRRLHVHGFAGISSIIPLASLKEVVITEINPQYAYWQNPQDDSASAGKAATGGQPNHPPAGMPSLRIIPRSTLSMLVSSPLLERLTIQASAPMLERILSESAVTPRSASKCTIHLRATVTPQQVVSCHKQYLKANTPDSSGEYSADHSFTDEGLLPFQTAAVERDWLDQSAALRSISRAEGLGFAVAGIDETAGFQNTDTLAEWHKTARRQAEDLSCSDSERQASGTPCKYAFDDDEQTFWSSQPIRDGAYCGHIGLPWARLENDIKGMVLGAHSQGIRLVSLFRQRERQAQSVW